VGFRNSRRLARLLLVRGRVLDRLGRHLRPRDRHLRAASLFHGKLLLDGLVFPMFVIGNGERTITFTDLKIVKHLHSKDKKVIHMYLI